jgi:hypothetical protein
VKNEKYSNNLRSQYKKDHDPEHPADGSSGRASFHPGTTTQGGSNFGQGSHYLAGESYKQGRERNAGSDYENEVGRLSDLDPGEED